MDSIDALIAARVNKPAGIATGDVPVWNGSTFVVPTGSRTGSKFLRDDGAWALAGGPGAPVTSLPGSPTDGQQTILTDSTTVPTYAWLMQWSTAASKWIFVGGSPLIAEVVTAETTTSATYTALATAGPSVTAAVAGTYLVQLEAAVSFPAQVFFGYMSYDIGGTGASDNDAGFHGAVINGGGAISRRRKKSLLAGTTLTSKYKVTGSTGTFQWRSLSITPVSLP